jgi:plasmid stabilization system protein ParE
VKFEISKRARRQIERIQSWWLENRPAVRDVFLEELEQAQVQLLGSPELGTVYTQHRTGAVRRLLLPRTHHHLYDRYQPSRDALTVLAIWGAPRGRGPRAVAASAPVLKRFGAPRPYG